ncbi:MULTISPECIES: DUF2141 domain-containing protein [Bizionia]|uniref:DUF2141 domain-containing protein n=1 Tax=Bizionia algoritergicola TaxID=291187 RepID=A0A5D0R3H7_9FLAO|nr:MULTISPECIES: DUF2141 domain-containing protein [Bizionia]OBX23665.1 hypothetical protein BAA08_03145 [Bizionia sp. APA-3]TYB75386.1 DUF2141 domain-containing protein [Bizionia algoritergicola]
MNIFFAYFSIIFGFLSTDAPKLTINIQNIEKIQGHIIIGIYNAEEGFLEKDSEIKHYKLTVKENVESLVIDDLPKGDYAISMYHDENSDGICNLNFIGIPKEPYGFSNNFKPKFSAPKFVDCKFSLIEDQVMNIKLVD